MERDQISSIVESLLFVSERPLTIKDLRTVLGEEVEPKAIKDALDAIGERLRSGQSGIQLAEVAGGFQLRTHPDHAEWVRRFLGAKPVRVSRAALETLAIVAYRQPITRAEIEEVRGVDCGGVLKMLLERRLLKILGKKEEPGRPILYGTSKEFLQFFGLKDLTELPTLREFHELSEESMATLEASGLEEAPEGAEPGAAAEDQATSAAEGAPAADAPAPADDPLPAETEAAVPTEGSEGEASRASAPAESAPPEPATTPTESGTSEGKEEAESEPERRPTAHADAPSGSAASAHGDEPAQPAAARAESSRD